MHLDTQSRNGMQIVHVRAERIDAAVAIQFKDRMREATGNGAEQVLLDLGDVSFIDSSGLGAIVAAAKQLGPGRRIDLVNLNPNVDRVFRLTRMDTIFAIHDSLDAACGAGAD